MLAACGVQDTEDPEQSLHSFFEAFRAGDSERCALYSPHDLGLGDAWTQPDVFAGDPSSAEAWEFFIKDYNRLRQDLNYYIESSEVEDDQALLTIVLESLPLEELLQTALDDYRTGVVQGSIAPSSQILIEGMHRALEAPLQTDKDIIEVEMLLGDGRWFLANDNRALWEKLEAGLMHLDVETTDPV